MSERQGLNVLIAPLNWGLGHATRCIPVIRFYLENHCKVFIASDGLALSLLKKEFPEIAFFELASYKASYPTANIVVNVTLQSPFILHAYFTEKKQIGRIVKENNIHLIISDNRFGVFSSDAFNVIMSHQLHLRTKARWAGIFSNALNHLAMRMFDEIWVPDFEGDKNLSGELSHPPIDGSIHYLGPISRIQPKGLKTEKGKILILLSGPEPQRTYLEKEIVKQAAGLNEKFIVLQGLTNGKHSFRQTGNITVFPFLFGEELREMLESAEIIITRSGYTTVMDLYSLGKKAVMIPTPGQSEQVFLAEHLKSLPNFIFAEQKKFSLSELINEIRAKPQVDPQKINELLYVKLKKTLSYF